MELREKVGQLPTQPGVYLFEDATGKILYVGKANSLRSRVRSYFLESRWQDAKTGSLVREIADLQYIVVDNPREALALENNLIKQHKPKFNVLLRDDKTYPYIKYTAYREVSTRLRDTAAGQGRIDLFWALLPGAARVPAGAFDSQAFSSALLHRGFDAIAPASVPAVLHSPLPGAVRGRAGDG